MATVYAFPPVETVGDEWDIEAPVNVSRSFFTGKRYVSAAQRVRRVASFSVSALAPDGSGAGYMSNLKILLEGGENLVRLNSPSINPWRIDMKLKAKRQSRQVTWSNDDDPSIEWTNGAPAPWFSGTTLLGEGVTDAGGFHAIAITGAPPNIIIARPGDYLTLLSPITATTGQNARVMTIARTDASGAATIRLMSQVTGSGRVNIGVSVSAVFEAVGMPRAMQPFDGDWPQVWSFREVFADEVDGGFVEVDPWR